MVAADDGSIAPPAAASRGGGVVLALSSLGDPWGVQLTSQVRHDALCAGMSTLVLTDPRWYQHLLGADADAALLTAIDLEQDGPRRVRSLSDRTRSGLAAFSAQMEPERFDVVSSSPVPAEAELLGPISYYGVDDVFARLSGVVVDRAVERGDSPGRLHRFDWEYFPGTTTHDDETSRSTDGR